MPIDETQRAQLSTATMFISFDLVNCTLYKSKHKGQWANSVSSVLKGIIQAFVKSPVADYQFWKVLGDEVVYTLPITQMAHIGAVLDDVYHIVGQTNEKIRNADIGDTQTAEILSVKATVWIADISPAHLCADNIYLEYQVSKDMMKPEYLGTDIDGGFRIAQYTSSERVVISADLAALFYQEDCLKPQFQNIHFVAYRILKGIWNGNPYPIFMYHGDQTVSFADSITEITNDKMTILLDYLEQAPQREIDPPYTRYEEQLLATLFKEAGLGKEVDQLVSIINNRQPN